MRFQDVVIIVDEGYRYTSGAYPQIPEKGTDDWVHFGVAHSLFHMMKSAGAIAAVLEGADHGSNLDRSLAREAALEQVVNALKLCTHLGLSGESIELSITEKYGRRQPD